MHDADAASPRGARRITYYCPYCPENQKCYIVDMVMHTLFVIATPIGNLKDITLRALEALRAVPYVACENPRQTQKLLQRWNITGKKFVVYREANKYTIIPRILEILKEHDAALLTDAGTPLISDPGAELVREAQKNSVSVVAIPGPSALTAALSISGIRSDKFVFTGFLPRSRGKLEKEFAKLCVLGLPIVAFEAPHRILHTLSVLATRYPDATLTLAKELTKIHERVLIGTPRELLERLQKERKLAQGEFVVILEPKAPEWAT